MTLKDLIQRLNITLSPHDNKKVQEHSKDNMFMLWNVEHTQRYARENGTFLNKEESRHLLKTSIEDNDSYDRDAYENHLCYCLAYYIKYCR